MSMSQSAFIKLVKGSKQQNTSLEEVKGLLDHYRQMTGNTGNQLDWDYQDAAFPYELQEQKEGETNYLLLKGKDPHHYHYLMVGIGVENETQYVQLVLPSNATHGDKAKGNEFSRYLAKSLGGELHLFNKRIMYFNKRK